MKDNVFNKSMFSSSRNKKACNTRISNSFTPEEFSQPNNYVIEHLSVNEPLRWRGGYERWARKRKVGCSNPSRHRSKS